MNKNFFGTIFLFLSFMPAISAQNKTRTYEELSSQIIATAKESDIICIGEHSHGDMNAIKTKAHILKDVARNMPTGGLLFEAPLVTSVITYLKNEPYSEFVWPFWKYKRIKSSLDSIISYNNLVCLGFDPQETCNFSRFSSFLISNGYLKNDDELSKMDSLLAITILTSEGNKTRNLTNNEAEQIELLIEKIKLKIQWPLDISKTEKELISLCFENRKYLAHEMTFQNVKDQMNFRDSIMALNIKHINEILKPELNQKKVIIWAANIHIAKKMNGGIWMMERFMENKSDMILSIGVIPKKRKKELKRFDFVVISGRPDYMPEELFLDYNCD